MQKGTCPSRAVKLAFRYLQKISVLPFIKNTKFRLNINAIKTNWIKGECRRPAYILALVQEFSPFLPKSYLSSPGTRQRERMTYISSKFPYSSRRESNFIWRGDFRILQCNLKESAERRKKYRNPGSSVMKRAYSSLLSPDLALQHWSLFREKFYPSLSLIWLNSLLLIQLHTNSIFFIFYPSILFLNYITIFFNFNDDICSFL